MHYLYVFQVGALLHEGEITGENGVCRSVPVIHASVAGCQLQAKIIFFQRSGRLTLQYAAQNICVFGVSGNLVGISINLCKSIQKELFINDTP